MTDVERAARDLALEYAVEQLAWEDIASEDDYRFGFLQGYDAGYRAGAQEAEQERAEQAKEALGVWTPERHHEFLERFVDRGNALDRCAQEVEQRVVEEIVALANQRIAAEESSEAAQALMWLVNVLTSGEYKRAGGPGER